MAPPINTMRSMCGRIAGSLLIAVAILLSGPVGTSVIPVSSAANRVLIMKSTACSGCNGVTGSNTSSPLMPVAPWMYSAV
jgi:hypothetical protein